MQIVDRKEKCGLLTEKNVCCKPKKKCRLQIEKEKCRLQTEKENADFTLKKKNEDCRLKNKNVKKTKNFNFLFQIKKCCIPD